jgi:hypothetical protein
MVAVSSQPLAASVHYLVTIEHYSVAGGEPPCFTSLKVSSHSTSRF